MPLDPEFVADCPYGPGGLLLDEIVEIDANTNRLRARLHTVKDLPLTREQRNHPVLHPPHVSGGLLIHLTGMLGFAHAYYVFGLRHADGWIGYGVRIHSARFGALARVGDPLDMLLTATKIRRGPSRIVARYSFEFRQGATIVYEGDQTAIWDRVGANGVAGVVGEDGSTQEESP